MYRYSAPGLLSVELSDFDVRAVRESATSAAKRFFHPHQGTGTLSRDAPKFAINESNKVISDIKNSVIIMSAVETERDFKCGARVALQFSKATSRGKQGHVTEWNSS